MDTQNFLNAGLVFGFIAFAFVMTGIVDSRIGSTHQDSSNYFYTAAPLQLADADPRAVPPPM